MASSPALECLKWMRTVVGKGDPSAWLLQGRRLRGLRALTGREFRLCESITDGRCAGHPSPSRVASRPAAPCQDQRLVPHDDGAWLRRHDVGRALRVRPSAPRRPVTAGRPLWPSSDSAGRLGLDDVGRGAVRPLTSLPATQLFEVAHAWPGVRGVQAATLPLRARPSLLGVGQDRAAGHAGVSRLRGLAQPARACLEARLFSEVRVSGWSSPSIRGGAGPGCPRRRGPADTRPARADRPRACWPR